MDAHRFDALIRRLAKRLDRRQSLRVLVIPGAIGLLSSTPAQAKNKKKKKITLCLAGQTLTVPKKKKGGYLAQGATLGACDGSNSPDVSCAAGTKACNGACIPTTACCAHAECGENAACLDGTCVCAVGFRSCLGTCLAEGRCCIDVECNAGFTCRREHACRRRRTATGATPALASKSATNPTPRTLNACAGSVPQMVYRSAAVNSSRTRPASNAPVMRRAST